MKPPLAVKPEWLARAEEWTNVRHFPPVPTLWKVGKMATIANTTNGEPAFHGIAHGSSDIAVFGQGAAVGIRGDGSSWHGVAGISTSTTGGAGVCGINNTGGSGVMGQSESWHGVYGETSAPGATGAAAVWGDNKADGSGVVGHSVSGAGVWAKSEHGPAGVFEGEVRVNGDVRVSGDIRLVGGDLAELFEVGPASIGVEPGALMSLDDEGRITLSRCAYDKRVVGVVAGAGTHRPGLILDSSRGDNTRPIAMVGKVYCHADASFAPIATGDLLTASPRPGHAMKALDAAQSFGAVVGKAMAPLSHGTGLLPIIVTLQ